MKFLSALYCLIFFGTLSAAFGQALTTISANQLPHLATNFLGTVSLVTLAIVNLGLTVWAAYLIRGQLDPNEVLAVVCLGLAIFYWSETVFLTAFEASLPPAAPGIVNFFASAVRVIALACALIAMAGSMLFTYTAGQGNSNHRDSTKEADH